MRPIKCKSDIYIKKSSLKKCNRVVNIIHIEHAKSPFGLRDHERCGCSRNCAVGNHFPEVGAPRGALLSQKKWDIDIHCMFLKIAYNIGLTNPITIWVQNQTGSRKLWWYLNDWISFHQRRISNMLFPVEHPTPYRQYPFHSPTPNSISDLI